MVVRRARSINDGDRVGFFLVNLFNFFFFLFFSLCVLFGSCFLYDRRTLLR